MLLVLIAAACHTADPFASGLEPPQGATRTDYVLSVAPPGSAEAPIGTEARFVAVDDDHTVIVRWGRTALRLGGQRRVVETRSRVEGVTGGPVERYVQARSGEDRSWSGSAWIPDLWPPPSSGRWPVLDPFSLEAIAVAVTIESTPPTTQVSWSGPGGDVRATYDGDGLVSAEQGVFRLERGSPPDRLADFDPVKLYAIPTAVQPRANRALVGRFVVDGALVRTDAPIWAQVPSVPVPPHPPTDVDAIVTDADDARWAVRELVTHVHHTLDGIPRPGTRDAMEALRSGRGDCDEAAAAFVALARELGLEADTVGGVVYREGAAGPGLYPHAWATVQIGGREVSVDPALGQAPADASHVALGVSAAEAASRLSRGVQIAVIELR